MQTCSTIVKFLKITLDAIVEKDEFAAVGSCKVISNFQFVFYVLSKIVFQEHTPRNTPRFLYVPCSQDSTDFTCPVTISDNATKEMMSLNPSQMLVMSKAERKEAKRQVLKKEVSMDTDPFFLCFLLVVLLCSHFEMFHASRC
jgi:hypothetical protein